jgi:hypothetical protein
MVKFSQNIRELAKFGVVPRYLQNVTPTLSTTKKIKNIQIEEYESPENENGHLINCGDINNINVDIPTNFSVHESN